jgi:hypothetical protein
VVREGIDQGEFRHLDSAIVTFALLGVQNWMITWFREGGKYSALEVADYFSDLFLVGLKADEALPS